MNYLNQKSFNWPGLKIWVTRLSLICLVGMFAACENQQQEITATDVGTEQLEPTERETEAATKLVSLTGSLMYNLQDLDLNQVSLFLEADGKTINYDYIDSVLDQTKYAKATELIEALNEYYFWKKGLLRHLIQQDREAVVDALFAEAQQRYTMALISDLKTEQECLDDQAVCISQAITSATSASFSCSGFFGQQLRDCFDGELGCDGNSHIILLFNECEAAVYSSYRGDILACQDAFDDCYEDCCVGGLAPPPFPTPPTIGGGSCSGCSGFNWDSAQLTECIYSGSGC